MCNMQRCSKWDLPHYAGNDVGLRDRQFLVLLPVQWLACRSCRCMQQHS